MSDLISAKALTEAMTKWARENFSTDDEYGHILQGMEKVLDLIEEQPTVDRWIPCSERLPKEDGNYLISGVWGSGKEAVGDCDFSVNDGYFRTAWNFDTLAWMPLPEPYEAGDQE